MGRRWVSIKKKLKIIPNNAVKSLMTRNAIRKEKRRKLLNKAINIAIGFLIPIALFFVSLIIEGKTVSNAASLIFGRFGVLMLNLLIIYMLYYLFLLITNRTTPSILLASIFYLIMPLISKIKYDIRGEVLLTNDFSLVDSVSELLGFTEISDSLAHGIVTAVFAITVFCFIGYLRKIKTERKHSAIALGIFAVILLIVIISSKFNRKNLEFFGIDMSERYAPNIIHERYGTYVGLHVNNIFNTVAEPANYSEKTIFEILGKVSGDSNKKPSGEEIKPNIIMIMSESFFDPYYIEGINYSEDPIPFIRKCLSQNTSGRFVSSTFAGGTSNVEFEAFTACPLEFLPYGISAYSDLENSLENCETIQKALKQDGYKTIAIHSYGKNFYNREKAYEKLGFDEFYDHLMMNNVHYYGKYISDTCVVENIIDQLEQSSGEPLFIWALTMQNHTPYSTSNYDEDALQIEPVRRKTITII